MKSDSFLLPKDPWPREIKREGTVFLRAPDGALQNSLITVGGNTESPNPQRLG
jgi:hypothetical protein